MCRAYINSSVKRIMVLHSLFTKLFREVERERARTRVREKNLKSKRRVEIQGAKVKLRLGWCSIEVRG